MLIKLLLTIALTLSFSTSFASLSCNLLMKLQNEELKDNFQFWEEYTELSSSGKLNDFNLTQLLGKYLHETPPLVEDESVEAITNLIPVTSSKKADKELRELPTKVVRKHYDDFVKIMGHKNGIQELYKNPGRWNLEKMIYAKVQKIYTVRLNDGYRVKFQVLDHEIKVLEVNANDIHTRTY